MILSTIRANSARSGYGSATSGAYYWDMPTTMVVGLATGETALNQTRLTFPSLPQALGGGKAISVSSLKLGLTQVSDATDGTSRTADITAQFTTMSDWNVAYDIGAAVGVNGETEITIPASAAWLLETYTGNVFVHLKATDGPRASFAGWNTGDSAPYLKVLWDYAENTIHTDTVETTAGVTSVTWTITPGADDARYVLAYRLGTATGTVYDGSGTSITWTPPYSVAEGIPDAASGQMELTLAVYDSDGALLRQETTYLAINTRAARNVKFRTLSYDGSEPVVMDELVPYYLGGETEMMVGITLTDTYADGATPVSVRFSLALDGWTSEAVWTASEMTKSGDEWTLPSKSMGIPPTGGTYAMSYTVTDTRGHVDSGTSTLIIRDYARPSVSLFSAERYGEIYDDDQQVIGYQTDPTGNHVWFSASAAIASVGGANVMNWALTLTSRADGTVLTASGTATGTSLVWSDDRDLIGDTIDPEIVWDAALTITDSTGFTATAYDVVPAGKAVLHLPACKNGIAFGGLSTATSEKPLGEMFYPFYAYAGIHGVTGWSLKEEDTGGVWLDGQKVYRKTLYARISTAGQAVDIPFPDGLQRIVHMQGILYTDDTINRTRPLSWYYNASLNASLWHSGSANVTVQANGEIGDAFVTIWYTKTAGIVITQQPEDATVALGGTATFSVVALGSPAYQWQQSTPPTATVGPSTLLHVTDALAAPVTALEAAVTPVQSGSGDPSPSNVRPISGWTGANVYVADEEPVLGDGRNLLAISDMTITLPLTQHAINYTYGGDGWVNATSSAISTTGNFITTFWGYNTATAYIGAGTYTLTIEDDGVLSDEAGATIRVQVYGSGLSGGGTGGTSGRYYQTAGTYSLVATGHIQRIGLYYLSGTNGKALDGRIRIKLERGDTSTGWCPAPEDLATPVDVAFGQTVYGGVLDAAAGTVTVSQHVDTFDGSSDESWSGPTALGSRKYFRATTSNNYQNVNHGIAGVTANWLPAISDAQDNTYTLSSVRLRSSSTASNYVFLIIGTDLSSITTVAELQAYLAENPLQVSYPVATPTTLTVTPPTIQTLVGENYVWTDTGDTSMTYYTTGTPTWSDISGETANALSVTASLEAAQRQYRCQLTEGSISAVSDAAGIKIS